MRPLPALIAAMLMLGAAQAFAQGGTAANPPASGQQSAKPTGAGEKIPPHQQPRAGDVPQPTFEQSAEDKALDRKLKGICRGC